MKNKPLLIIIAFLLLIITVKAYPQKVLTTKVSGIVMDTLFRPIEYATIQLFSKQDSSISYGAISQSDGSYSINNVALGEYSIKASAIGYKSESTKVIIAKAKKNTPINLIRLKENIIEIDGVEITVKRKGMSEKVDKMVFVPDSLLLRTAKTGIDVIKKIPEIRVDKKDMSLSILGNKNILVLINGIDNNRSIESIHPEDIERVEIITHPSVKYHSDIASVINIVLKGYKEKGITISSNLYYCMNKKNHSGNIQIDYQLGKWSFFASYAGNYNITESVDSTFRTDVNENNLIENSTYLLANSKANMGYNRVQYGFDYNMNKNNIFSFTSNLTTFDLKSFQHKKVLFSLNSTPFRLSNIESLYNSDKTENNISLYYLHKFNSDDNKLTVNANIYTLNNMSDYLINDNIQYYSPQIFNNHIRNTYKTNKQNSINTKIDYSYPINNIINLETGYQLYFRNITNDVKATDAIESNLRYHDFRNSLYANMVFTTKGWGFQTGTRAENFNINVDQIKHVQTTFLPFSSILYTPKPNHSFKLTYRKTLEYPKYSYLNPFNDYSSDSLSYSAGNPYLKPEQKHNLNFKYSFRKGDTYLSSGLYYNYLYNLISQEVKLLDNVIAYRYENMGKAQQYGVDFAFSSVLFDWVEIEILLRGYYTDFLAQRDHNGFSYASEFGITTPLWAGFDLEVSGIIAEKEVDYNGYSQYGGYIDEILLTKEVNKNLFIGFSVWQPFFKVKDTYKQWDNTFKETNKYTEINSTSYLFNITYFFNSGKKINKIKKESYMENDSKDKNKQRR